MLNLNVIDLERKYKLLLYIEEISVLNHRNSRIVVYSKSKKKFYGKKLFLCVINSIQVEQTVDKYR